MDIINKRSKESTTEANITNTERRIEFTDDLMFSRVMKDTDICKEFIETILDEKISGVVKHESQKNLHIELDAKYIRLDVYMEDEVTMVNTEMQKSREAQLGRRSRYYGSNMDINQLNKGQGYEKLKERYVLFICEYDPYKKDLCRYSFHSVCKEDPEVLLDNGVNEIVINLKGNLKNYNEKFTQVIRYMNGSMQASESKYSLIHEIEKEVMRANLDPEWRRIHMTLADKFVEVENTSRQQGLEEGKVIGKEIGKEMGKEIGRAEGIEIGEARGREIGEARGREEAEKKAVEMMVETLKELGLRPEQIKDKIQEKYGIDY